LTSRTEGIGQQQGTIEIRKSIVIDASPEVVFKSSELTNWFPDNALFDGRSEENSPSIRKDQKSKIGIALLKALSRSLLQTKSILYLAPQEPTRIS